MARRGNYKFLEKFSWYVPGVGGMFGLLAWLLVGALFGGLATIILQAAAGPEAVKEYGNLLSYPLMFIPPMLYASIKSSRLSMDNDGFKLDNDNYAPVGGLMCVILVNLSSEDFVVERGERVAQLVLARHEVIEWEEADVLADSNRGVGGFGSTGTK